MAAAMEDSCPEAVFVDVEGEARVRGRHAIWVLGPRRGDVEPKQLDSVPFAL